MVLLQQIRNGSQMKHKMKYSQSRKCGVNLILTLDWICLRDVVTVQILIGNKAKLWNLRSVGGVPSPTEKS